MIRKRGECRFFASPSVRRIRVLLLNAVATRRDRRQCLPEKCTTFTSKTDTRVFVNSEYPIVPVLVFSEHGRYRTRQLCLRGVFTCTQLAAVVVFVAV